MKPTCAAVLARLRAADGAWVRGLDLASPAVGGLRFGGRIHELRHEYGYTIERRSDPRSAVDQYRLVEGANTASGSVPALTVLTSSQPVRRVSTALCACGRALGPKPARGPRPSKCARCLRIARAHSYIRSGQKILAQIADTEAVAT